MAGGNIKVVVRVRPFNNREKDRNAQCIVQMKDKQTVLTPPDGAAGSKAGKSGSAHEGPKTFAFDHSYWGFDKEDSHYAGQDDLFKDLGIPLLDNAFQGYNNCIFAYGQTGSGKSYSMMGYGPDAGVIPKICQDMFNRIDTVQMDPNLKCTVEVSYLEIYNERVRDLLNPTTKGNLRVREHPATGPYVEDLAKLAVSSFKEIENLMDEGNKARTVAATNMNETSSRSHAVFTLTLTQKRHDVETRMDTEKVAKISLVDLAGSERATSTGATGARLKEGAEINRSLSTLGRVIAALADLSQGKSKKATQVPYRDSVLTWLLKDSLGGNSLTAMIAAISPADINFEETLSTLRYADSAKRIKNHAVVNEDPNARMIRELKEELAQLRAKLGGGGVSAAGQSVQDYPPGTPLDQQFVTIMQADGSMKKVSKADIADQLSQSEKLYKDLNQTWEEKLLKTQDIQKEREAALEELGISIEKGFVGLTTPKKMPHLVNLSDDPLLAECLVYNLKPGITKVGNSETGDNTLEIKLGGSRILKLHCTFENNEAGISVTPSEGAALMINGHRIEKQQKLKSGDRVILGDFHIFRFTNPQEARTERVVSSKLRHSYTPSQLSSPSPRPSHDRGMSLASELDSSTPRSVSPTLMSLDREMDWSSARREAAVAILGVDQKINHLTDEELDALFDDVQRARAVRRGRPESRLYGHELEDEDGSESDRHTSNDNFSLDTALTIPSSPKVLPVREMIRSDSADVQRVREEMTAELEKQREEFESRLQITEADATKAEAARLEKEQLEADLKATKSQFEAQLKQQQDDFEIQYQQLLRDAQAQAQAQAAKDGLLLTPLQRARALHTIERWHQLRNRALAEELLKNAALLKEAQVMSQIMDKGVTFQFGIVEEGQALTSSYDLVLNGMTDDEEMSTDPATKPYVAVRVTDYDNSIIRIWSIAKLEQRVQLMRQMHQYHDRPEYMQHFQFDNPFTEAFLPSYSLVGAALIPLTAVFETRVQDYTVEVISPWTQQSIGWVKVSLEPSLALAPSSTLMFTVVMHELVGFAEREGTEVHAQLSVPGISKEGGFTTTQALSGFNESPLKFESVHSMSLPVDSSPKSCLRVSIFSRITSMHLDKLLSWDEIREMSQKTTNGHSPKEHRRAEQEYVNGEQHDVYLRIKVLEMSENGNYEPVEVEQKNELDSGTYQLHQGLQRRISVQLTHNASEALDWEHGFSLRAGNVRLIDMNGNVPDLEKIPDIHLKIVKAPAISSDMSNSTKMILVAQWDSSLHESSLLDRPTAEGYSIRFTLSLDAVSSRCDSVLTFVTDLNLNIRPRSWIRPQAIFGQLWRSDRVVRSTTSIFEIVLRPKRAITSNELWRLDSSQRYVKGEEDLRSWSPRGLSLVRDFVQAQNIKRRVVEIDACKAFLAQVDDSMFLEEPRNGDAEDQPLSPEKMAILQKFVRLWQKPLQEANLDFDNKSDDETKQDGVTGKTNGSSHAETKYVATIMPIPRNPLLIKAGALLTPSTIHHGSWIRRHAELRPPYLHLFNLPDYEEIAIVNLRNATVDAEPEVGRLLKSDRIGRENVFAVYGIGASWLFACVGGGRESWIFSLDEAFMSTSTRS